MAPFTSWLSLLLVILLVSLPLLLLVLKRNHSSKFPPGPPRLPIIGNLHQLNGLSHRTLWQLSQRYGPLTYLKLGSKPALVVSSSKLASEVMKTQDVDFCNRPPFTTYKKLSYNFLDLTFAQFGEYYREMRKVANNELLSLKRVKSFRHIREEEVARAIATISHHACSSRPVNLTELVFGLSSNVLTRAAFSKSYHRGGEQTSFFSNVAATQAMFVAFFMADYLPWLGWIDVLTGQRARLEKCFWDLDAFYEEVIEEHVAAKRKEPGEEDILDAFIRLQKDLHLTKDHIKAQLMNLIIAGTDTSGATIVWAMSELIKKPREMKKVQDEIRRIVGNEGRVDEEVLGQLEYLPRVVKETLRLHPPGPLLIPRHTTKHCKLNGYDVAPNTLVLVNAFAIGQEPESWENPAEFQPERFANGTVDFKGNDFQFIPFGSGRRICPGMNFGVMTTELVLANLLYCFDWELPPGMNADDVDMSELPGVTVHKKSPLLLVPTSYIYSADGKTD